MRLSTFTASAITVLQVLSDCSLLLRGVALLAGPAANVSSVSRCQSGNTHFPDGSLLRRVLNLKLIILSVWDFPTKHSHFVLLGSKFYLDYTWRPLGLIRSTLTIDLRCSSQCNPSQSQDSLQKDFPIDRKKAHDNDIITSILFILAGS